ncbi:UNKNOWN [Stylonychia lemnae]|uniref:Uncharacterized protein n=1 Tax=Stylonychia lemnae TaxID=5949 RepID=A0A077ZU41_STYLE|nr:UNKNOWN [Stylonychia lemnae]|eukprot:CDW73423.1 UNKNOWN [Stylonychia lemnae]
MINEQKINQIVPFVCRYYLTRLSAVIARNAYAQIMQSPGLIVPRVTNAHYVKQNQQLMSCPLKCGYEYLRKNRKKHLESCRKIKQICGECGYQTLVQNQEEDPHKCTDYLKYQLRLSQEKYELQEKQFEDFKIQSQSQGNKHLSIQNKSGYQNERQYLTTMHKYPLEKLTLNQMRRLPNHAKYLFGWLCNGNNFIGCQSGQTLQGPFRQLLNEVIYHCSQCKFDFCEACFQKYGNVHHHDLQSLTYQAACKINKAYIGGWKCNAIRYFGCNQGSMAHKDPNEILYHDSQRSFNLCQKCFILYSINDKDRNEAFDL